MFRIKHLMDRVEPEDGERLWVESIGLTKDLVDWCKVSHVTSHLGPPRMLAEWFDVIAVDLPGHGDSPRPTERHAIGALADAVERRLRFAGVLVEPLVGHDPRSPRGSGTHRVSSALGLRVERCVWGGADAALRSMHPPGRDVGDPLRGSRSSGRRAGHGDGDRAHDRATGGRRSAAGPHSAQTARRPVVNTS